MINYVLENNIVTLVIHREDTPMNVLDGKFLEALDKNIDRALAEDGLKGIILTSDKPEFVAGADLAMLAAVNNVEDSLAVTQGIGSVLRKMETSGVPVVAAINGTALGGGYELTLGCHYRVALNHPKIQIGLPEVTLGLLPGGGGTQRLPRLIGFEKALPLLLEGRRLNPEKALKAGMVNELANSPEELLGAAKNYILENGNAVQPWDEKKFKIPGGGVQSPKGYQTFAAGTAMIAEKTQGNYPAPKAILSCVYEGLQLPFDSAIEVEGKYFATLVLDSVSKSMIRTLFFGMNACNKGFARPKGVEKKKVQKLGVLGAGMMGAGIAYVSAKAGIPVILKDISVEAAEKGKAYSEKVLNKLLKRGKITEEGKQQVLDLIRTTDDPNAVEGCDMVIETVIEDRKIKALVTEQSEKVIPDHAIMASNTSTIPITTLAKASCRPENFIGLHYFSPVDKMPLVEIIRGEKTSDEALAACIDFTKQLKKTPIVVNDKWGFYTSRVFMTYVEEGIFCLNDGVTPAFVENAAKSLGMPVGPLAVADEVSLDLVEHILAQAKIDVGEDFVDSYLDGVVGKFVNDLKRLGRKSGGGFYTYPEKGKKFLWEGLGEHFPVKENAPGMDMVRQRLLYRQVIETVKCFEENVLITAQEADVGSILGWGFPAYLGGPLNYVDTVGAETFIQNCKTLEEQFGERFAVPAIMEKMLNDGSKFYK